MSLPKKRKVNDEGRVFQEKWRTTYFFTVSRDKPICLICKQELAVLKEYNVKRHFDTHHAEKYSEYTGKLREEKAKELELALKRQQAVFHNVVHTSESAVKASYVIAREIARTSRPFTEGEFVKDCMLKAAELVCPDKRQAFANISLGRSTITTRVCDLSDDLTRQLQEKAEGFSAFSIAVDESTDICDVAQLAVFIRGVDDDMVVTEELVDLVPLKGTTTSEDIFSGMMQSLDKLGVDWTKAVSLATDGAPSMIGRKAGVAAKLKQKLQSNRAPFLSFHCILHQESLCSKTLKMAHVMDVVFKTVNFIRARALNHRQFQTLLVETETQQGLPYHTDVRWLSRGAVLRRFYDLRGQVKAFMEKKKALPELESEEWLQDLAFMVDITEHLNQLNVRLQGRNQAVTEFFRSIRAFEMKLTLWKTQVASGNLCHFPTLKERCDGTPHPSPDTDRFSDLSSEFEERFLEFRRLEADFELFDSPFSTAVNNVSEHLQMEVIDLQCDAPMKNKFDEVGSNLFYSYLGPKYPKLRTFAQRILSMFGTTYVCEQVFSVMNLNKSKVRSQLTNEHLNAVLKVATAQSLSADVEKIVEKKRCQVSSIHSK